MLDKVARDRITFHLDKAIEAQQALTIRMRRAKETLSSFNAVARQDLPLELVAGSKAAYNAAYHIDRAGEAWEIADG